MQTVECYSDLKKKEIMAFSSKYMDVENTTISEMSQTQKN